MPRSLVLRVAAATVATVGLVGSGLSVADAEPAGPVMRARPAASNVTPFALGGGGYGLSVQGGQVPVSTDGAAFEVIACTNRAGLQRTNQVADVSLPSLGTVSGVKTRVWTSRSGRVVSSWARNTLGKVTLSDSPLGKLVLSAVSTTARAYHDGARFRTSTHTDLAKLQFQPAVGPALTLPIPAPNRPVVIPGFAKVTIAQAAPKGSAQGADAYANGVKVKLYRTDTVVRVAHAHAKIARGVKVGMMAGQAYGVGGRAAGDIVRLGREPLVKMPCQGTGGAVQDHRLLNLDLGGQVVVNGAKSSQMGNQTKRRAWGYERSEVGSISLGKGALRITGIVGEVHVTRKGKHRTKLVRNANGTAIGRIVVNGKAQAVPTRTIEIPGLAKLQPKVVTRVRNGIAVTALRITLLDGSGAVLDLGNARLAIKRPGRIVR